MLYWYNNSPNVNGKIPSERLYTYKSQLQVATGTVKRDISLNPYKVGDKVYVKPCKAKCTSVWFMGNITELVSNTAVKVDGMNRHVGDIRFCWRPASNNTPRLSVDEIEFGTDF